jgi:hypothetical protein
MIMKWRGEWILLNNVRHPPDNLRQRVQHTHLRVHIVDWPREQVQDQPEQGGNMRVRALELGGRLVGGVRLGK